MAVINFEIQKNFEVHKCMVKWHHFHPLHPSILGLLIPFFTLSFVDSSEDHSGLSFPFECVLVAGLFDD